MAFCYESKRRPGRRLAQLRSSAARRAARAACMVGEAPTCAMLRIACTKDSAPCNPEDSALQEAEESGIINHLLIIDFRGGYFKFPGDFARVFTRESKFFWKAP